MTTQFIDGEPDGLRLCNCVGSLITTVYMPRTHLSRAHQLDLPSRGVYYLLKVDGVRIERLNVGQTTQGINRLNDHNQKKSWWDRAVLFLSDDSNNFTLDTASGLEKYAIERATKAFPDIVENKVAPKYKINKSQRPFIESLFSEIRFMMATLGLPVDGTDAKPVPPQATPVKPESKGEAAKAVPVTMTKRKMTVSGTYDPESDALTVLAGSKIDLGAAVSVRDKATAKKREELLNSGRIISSGDGVGELTTDVTLSAPTAAAKFVFGGSINGGKYWKCEDGRSLKEVWG